MRTHAAIDATAGAGGLVNGRWLQLRVLPTSGRRSGIAAELLRKRDQHRLLRWPRLPSRVTPGQTRLARHEHVELDALLHRLRGGSATTTSASRLAQTATDAAAALRRIGLPAGIAARQRLPLCPEPSWLIGCGTDLVGRDLHLEPATARAWQRMRSAAAADGVALLPVSGFRSLDYQAGLVARKLARGMAMDDILRYSALPGRSEHHLGTVLDLHDGDGPALEEAFENSVAFAWLGEHAGRFGFHLSYPRGNPWQIGYEPWHWRYLPGRAID